MNWEGLIKVLAFAWRDWIKPWRTSVRIVGVLSEIQTEHLLTTSLERYCYTNRFGLSVYYKTLQTKLTATIDDVAETWVEYRPFHCPTSISQHAIWTVTLEGQLIWRRSLFRVMRVSVVQPSPCTFHRHISADLPNAEHCGQLRGNPVLLLEH
jgi:hypothetical protein